LGKFLNIQKISDVIDICKNIQIQKYLQSQDVEFDGLVIKLENVELREKIGATEHHPRWAIAYKFPAQQFATKILSVDFQVGRT
jgi:DNA ligase (NAD+)